MLVMFWFVASTPAAPQNGGAARSVEGKATPMTPDGHPDLNGYWVGPEGNDEQFLRAADGSVLYDFSVRQGQGGPACYEDSCQNPNQPSYTPAFLPRVKAIGKTEFGGTTPEDPVLSCKPAGVPRTQLVQTGGYAGAQIIQTPQVIAIIHGDYTDRLIYTDGRPHPKDLEPSYMGDSIGHWEGNTLVVDVAGLNDDTWLGGGIGGPNIYTSIHSDKEHVVERWTREGDELTYEATVDDPVALTKPWTIAPRKVYISHDPKQYLVTYYCDGSGIAQTMKEHYVKPNPEDRDIKYKCGGHHCDVPTPTK
jgi:hypothetical protein